jgi:peptidoglycan hydrolase-like protein with peptidoglycan-binding domain
MAGPAIERIQERLRGLGVYPGLIDGIFGSQTEAAVIAIQSRSNLDPDGIVGPETWTILLR